MSEKKFYYKVEFNKLRVSEVTRETTKCFYSVPNWSKTPRRYSKAEYFSTALEAWEAEEIRLRSLLQQQKDALSQIQQRLQIAQKEAAAYRKTNK